jgi:ketosteroid isomerase-like protein
MLAAMIIALILPTTASKLPMQDAPHEAAQIVDAFHDALAEGDRAAALETLDDGVQIYEQGWVESSKAEYAKAHLAGDLKFARSTTSQLTSRSGSLLGDLAFVTSEGRTTGVFEGKLVNSITLETMVLRHFADGWRIVHIHWSSRSPK